MYGTRGSQRLKLPEVVVFTIATRGKQNDFSV